MGMINETKKQNGLAWSGLDGNAVAYGLDKMGFLC